LTKARSRAVSPRVGRCLPPALTGATGAAGCAAVLSSFWAAALTLASACFATALKFASRCCSLRNTAFDLAAAFGATLPLVLVVPLAAARDLAARCGAFVFTTFDLVAARSFDFAAVFADPVLVRAAPAFAFFALAFFAFAVFALDLDVLDCLAMD